MSNSIFTTNLKSTLKNKRLEGHTEEEKQKYRYKTIEQFFLELGNRENRFIFYCPDITVVNNIVKIIYDIALVLQKNNLQVVILHEIKGFKCKWILEDSKYKNIPVDYIISKSGKKSKKEKNQYSFKPTDTLIIPDLFQDMLENIKDVKLIQKVVLVTSYSGIGNLQAGSTFKQLDVSSLLFLEDNIKKDYESLFSDTDTFLIKNFSIDRDLFNPSKVNLKEIYPVICISKLGNDKLCQLVTNIFYNKYPKFKVFSFKIIDRVNYEQYINSLKHCCLYFNMDETLSSKQCLLEVMSLGIPATTYERKEVEEDFISCKKDPFEIANFIAKYCSLWLNNTNSYFIENTIEVSKKLNVEEYNINNFENSIQSIFEELHQNRIKFFASIQKSIEDNGQKKEN